jgi:hypothetical protein
MKEEENPSHFGIEGNEKTDYLTKKAVNQSKNA